MSVGGVWTSATLTRFVSSVGAWVLLIPSAHLHAQRCTWTADPPVQFRASTLGLLPTSAAEFTVGPRSLVVAANGFLPVPQATSGPADSTEARRVLGALAYVVDRDTWRVTDAIPKPPNWSSTTSSSRTPIVQRTTTGETVALWPEQQKDKTSSAFSITVARYARGAWRNVDAFGGFDFIPWYAGDHMIVEHERATFVAFSAMRAGRSGVAALWLEGEAVDIQFFESGTPMPPRALWLASEAHHVILTYESVEPEMPSARALATRHIDANRRRVEVGVPTYQAVTGAVSILGIARLRNSRQSSGWLLLVSTPAKALETRYRSTLTDSVVQTIALENTDAMLIGARPEAASAVLWVEGERPSLRLVGLLDGRALSAPPIAAVDDIVHPPLLLPTRDGGVDLVVTRLAPDRIESTLSTTGLFRISIAPNCGR